MKEGFRQSMAWWHTWLGLLAGWILYFVFLTGTTGYFDAEIDRWMRPELPLPAHSSLSPEKQAEMGLSRLQAIAPGAERWTVEVPNREGDYLGRIGWRSGPQADGSGERIESEPLYKAGEADAPPRKTGGGQFLYQLHYRLHYMDQDDAAWIVGFCTMMMFVALITGVIAHRRIFRDFFTFRPGPGQRSWLDAHNLVGVVALPFHLVITYSGLLFFMYMYMPQVMNEVYRLDNPAQQEFFDLTYPAPLGDVPRAGIAQPLTDVAPLLAESAKHGGELLSVSVRNPGDANARIVITRKSLLPRSHPTRLVYEGVTGERLSPSSTSSVAGEVHDTLIGLHEGVFAGWGTRWLYFISGLLGTAMVATGLVLWTIKRRARSRSHAGLWVTERLNACTIVGLPIGIAGYFWANRLLPVEFEHRGLWEPQVLFCLWGLTLVYVAVRPVMRAWVELLAAASALFTLLPVLNVLTTQRHLGITLRHGDWALAGFDLVALGVGVTFGAVAWYLHVRSRKPAPAFDEEQQTTKLLTTPASVP